jgi:hypothetical protein
MHARQVLDEFPADNEAADVQAKARSASGACPGGSWCSTRSPSMVV